MNPRKTQKSQLHPTEAERYSAKLLSKAEVIVASANKIWGSFFSLVLVMAVLTSGLFLEREMQFEMEE